jgi:hypothetical protein
MVRVTAPPKTKRSNRRRVILGLGGDDLLSVFWFEDLVFFLLFLGEFGTAILSGLSVGAGTPGGTGIPAGGVIVAGGAVTGNGAGATG